MFAGHFGVAAMAKAKNPEMPVWSLMLSTQAMDIAFIPLMLVRIETIVPIGEGGRGQTFIYADFSHSLVGALLIAAIVGLLTARAWGKRSGWIHAGVAFSHWALDLLVHHPDMVLLPGNLGDLPVMGLGLWRWPTISDGVELLLVLVGGAMYLHSVLKRADEPAGAAPRQKGRAVLAGSVMISLMVLSLIMGA